MRSGAPGPAPIKCTVMAFGPTRRRPARRSHAPSAAWIRAAVRRARRRRGRRPRRRRDADRPLDRVRRDGQARLFACQSRHIEEARRHAERCGERVDRAFVGFDIEAGDTGDRLRRNPMGGQNLADQRLQLGRGDTAPAADAERDQRRLFARMIGDCQAWAAWPPTIASPASADASPASSRPARRGSPRSGSGRRRTARGTPPAPSRPRPSRR